MTKRKQKADPRQPKQVRASNLTAGLLQKAGAEFPKIQAKAPERPANSREAALAAAAELIAKRPGIVWAARAVMLAGLLAIFGAGYGIYSRLSAPEAPSSQSQGQNAPKPGLSSEIPK